MNAKMKRFIELSYELEEVDASITKEIRKLLNNDGWLVCIHTQDKPHVNMSLWFRGRSLEENIRFSIHSTHATMKSRGNYTSGTCSKVKEALDNWLKETADEH